MLRRFPAVLLVALFLASAAFADVGIGDTRDSVLQTYGKPTSIAKRGDHEIFLYPKGARIEFIDDKVTDVKGPLPAPLPPPAAEFVAATAESIAPPAPAPNPVAPEKKSPLPPEKIAPPPAYNPAVAANALGDKVEKMNSAWGELPSLPKKPSALDSVPALITGLLLRFAFTIIALKAAFKYWEMDAFWKGILAIAGIDLGAHAILKLLGPVSGGLTTMSAVENGIPGIVLIFTINKFCFNKRIQNAITTAAAVKTVVTLCYIFGGVMLLNTLYG